VNACPDCGHEHAGDRLANICVGCPCERRTFARNLRVTMPDGSRWDVPIEVIARSRAENYAREFGGDVERSLAEDTLPLFAEHPYEIIDWATGNMNWSDVAAVATRAPDAPRPRFDWEDGWMNGEKEIVS